MELTISNTNTQKPTIALVYKLDSLAASANFECTQNSIGKKKRGSVPLFNPLKPGEALFNVAYDMFHSNDSLHQEPWTYRLTDWILNSDVKGDPFTYAWNGWAGGEKVIVPDVYECYEAETRIALKQY